MQSGSFQFTRPRGARPKGDLPLPGGLQFQFTRPRGARQIFSVAVNRLLVSIHAPTGGATSWSCPPVTVNLPFQFTRPRGARRGGGANRPRTKSFNSRAHGGRDHRLASDAVPRTVSIHAPTGGATKLVGKFRVGEEFQFTRPRGARPEESARISRRLVSIHAPTGGATSGDYILVAGEWFQFTRPRGARPRRGLRAGRLSRFNSRAHGGRDRVRATIHRDIAVSIHAPTGGATISTPSRMAASAFQFTRPRGARHTTLTQSAGAARFNSRAHGGRDWGLHDSAAKSWSFNSRAHGGRDAPPPRRPSGRRVSIHAPTGGATCLILYTFCGRKVSIHAPTGGATARVATQYVRDMFQFTRPRGARPSQTSPKIRRPRFNSRAHGGRDKADASYSATQAGFNSRAHGGRDRPGGDREHPPPRFNSRAHGGRDRSAAGGWSAHDGFNSRAHGGRDATHETILAVGDLFQFTRPRGARRRSS